MAGQNFVVQNGLQVGPLVIDAATGSINTTGTVSVAGVAVSQISQNDSSIGITDTGTGSSVTVIIDGTTEHTIDANGVNLATGDRYAIGGTSVLNSTTLGSGVTASSLTSVGTLTGLTVSGATQTAAITSSGTIIASVVQAGTIGNTGATLTGTLSTASQPNITTLAGVTSIGASGSTTLTGTLQTATQNLVTTMTGLATIGSAGQTITASGGLTVAGNLTVQGQTSQVGTSNLTINDSIIDLHTFANLAPLTSDDGRDVGIKFHYYKTAQGGDQAAFLGWANDSGALEYYVAGTEVGNVFTGTAYGTVKSGEYIAANTTAATSTTTGALRVAGGAGIAKSVYIGGDGTTAITHTGHIIPSANLSYNLGSSTAWYNTFYGVSTQAQYADLAENYQADSQYEPGTVVEFGGEAEVTIATDSTKRVAGVVSTNPAHLMNGGLTGKNVVPLALQGRVPCKVIGPVRKGDLMVSAGFGYAKTNNDAATGQVIGKALADFSGAKGIIEVVVGRV